MQKKHIGGGGCLERITPQIFIGCPLCGATKLNQTGTLVGRRQRAGIKGCLKITADTGIVTNQRRPSEEADPGSDVTQAGVFWGR